MNELLTGRIIHGCARGLPVVSKQNRSLFTLV